MCQWKGTADQLSNHTKSCSYVEMTPLLNYLVTKINDLETKCTKLQTENETLKRQIPKKCKHCSNFIEVSGIN